MNVPDITHVIFDVDGTLIDESGVLVAQAQAVAWKFGDSAEDMQRVITEFFRANDKAERLKEEGNTALKGDIRWYMMEISAVLGIALSEEESQKLATDWTEAFHTSLGTPQLFPDVSECLKALQKEGKILMIASGGSLESRERILSETGIQQYFSHVFSSQQVGFQKQDIRFWETVLTEINVPPKQIAVVGNQINDDIMHPKILGMITVLVKRPGMLSKKLGMENLKADYTISNLDTVIDAL